MIRVCDLYKQYGNLEVLKGLSLDVHAGETVVILGRSGVGKSVLLKLILGLEMPDSGYVEIDGVNITQLAERKRNKMPKRIGMLFQGAALFDSLNIAENTAFYLRQHERNLPDHVVKKRVEEALEMVGLRDCQEKFPSELSGGMRKRAALARLIIYHPQIILYDEPTTGLDPITAMQINHLIIATQQQLDATSIVVTHDLRSASEVGKKGRLAFHHEGKIAYIASMEEFMKIRDPMVQEFFRDAFIAPEKHDL